MNDDENVTILNIGKKLRLLDCTLLGNGEDWWLRELLLTPGIHRFQLLDWILSKLNFSSPKVCQPQNSPEEHAKNMLPTLAALGFCRSTDRNLILGKSSKSSQLEFWQRIIDLLWKKWSLSNEAILSDNSKEQDNENFGIFSDGSQKEESVCAAQSIQKMYEKSCGFIELVAKKVNMKDLFEEKINLFPLDVNKDMTNILSDSQEIVPLSDLMANVSHYSDSKEDDSIVTSGSLDLLNEIVFSMESDDQKVVDEEIKAAAKESQDVAGQLPRLYNELKPFLQQENAELSDIGKPFASLHGKQKEFSKLTNCLSIAKTSCLELQQQTDCIPSPCSLDSYLSDSLVKDFTGTLQQLLDQENSVKED